MAAKEYKRLSTGRYWLKVSSLWRGQGHLLLASSSGFVENYKRFYFRDIQAVLLRPHNRREVWSFPLTLGLLFFLWVQFALHPKHTEFLGYGAAAYGAVFFAACLAGNLLLGPGCVCQLKTAIQTVELPIKRKRAAQKIMRQLMPLIEEAQRGLPEGGAPSLRPAFSSAAVPAAPPESSAKRPFNPKAHGFLFGALLLDAFLEAGRFFTLNFVYYMVDWLGGVAVVFSLIVALVWQARSETPRILRHLTTIAVFYIIVSYFLGVVSGFSLGRQHPEAIRDQWAFMKMAAAQPPDATGFTLLVTIFSLVVSSVLGLIGILELMRVLRRKTTG